MWHSDDSSARTARDHPKCSVWFLLRRFALRSEAHGAAQDWVGKAGLLLIRGFSFLVALSLALVTSFSSHAAEVSAAVAANFSATAQDLGSAFTAETGNTVSFSFGATGLLYAQISQGAPFQVFLAADDGRPGRAVTDGYGIDGTVFTYAVGKVVLYSPSLDLTDGGAVLVAGRFDHIAIADPNSAPYGAAAVEAIEALGLRDALASKTVVGENISQALQFVESGNAELGFVSQAQVIDQPPARVWRVPAEYYSPIRQAAVLLKPGEKSAAARAFLDFIRSADGKAIIAKYGYATD